MVFSSKPGAVQPLLDTEARESISKELGHNRAGIVSAYCGR